MAHARFIRSHQDVNYQRMKEFLASIADAHADNTSDKRDLYSWMKENKQYIISSTYRNYDRDFSVSFAVDAVEMSMRGGSITASSQKDIEYLLRLAAHYENIPIAYLRVENNFIAVKVIREVNAWLVSYTDDAEAIRNSNSVTIKFPRPQKYACDAENFDDVILDFVSKYVHKKGYIPFLLSLYESLRIENKRDNVVMVILTGSFRSRVFIEDGKLYLWQDGRMLQEEFDYGYAE